ncbi:MAG TPA: Tex-like N-terminal domain-containing protein, partial [Clostridia bacterium]|nr:Tex-like N-terminal domain-containing protein [Clostridia bacterium]
MESCVQILSREFNKNETHVQNVVSLIDEGYTIPFIARYRKEMHGTMDDTVLRDLADRLTYLRNLAERREEVKKAITAQDKLTPELEKQIDEAKTLAEVEDIYRPYKQKRRTRATIAKEKGLEPLALVLLEQKKDLPPLETLAEAYVDAEKGVASVEEALAGASDIIAEIVSDNAEIRRRLRDNIAKGAKVGSEAAKEEDSVYSLYYKFEQPLSKMQGHQILAINRGEKEGLLKVSLEVERDLALGVVTQAVVKPGSRATEFVRAAAADAYDRLILPSMERETRGTMTDMA